jgi:hypothetical protein
MTDPGAPRSASSAPSVEIKAVSTEIEKLTPKAFFKRYNVIDFFHIFSNV